MNKNNHLMSVKIGTPPGQRATKVLRCGSGEPGKEAASNFSARALQASRKTTGQLTSAPGGKGLFGVELFSGVMK
jgi:formate-dependent phosphoribosylglycinamide formyltransferase (GAR transformylase)